MIWDTLNTLGIITGYLALIGALWWWANLGG